MQFDRFCFVKVAREIDSSNWRTRLTNGADKIEKMGNEHENLVINVSGEEIN